MKHLARFLLAALLLALPACETVAVHTSVPESQVAKATVVGFPADIRSWGDEPPENIDQVIEKRITRWRERHADYYAAHKTYPSMDYLAISGGSNNGAYGAGILCGWTLAGGRPDFAIVTGVSTGALIAPFAFLGSKYDYILKQEYTTVKSDNIFIADAWTAMRGLAGGMSMVDTSPLKNRIDELVTPKILEEIAAEHHKGRRLLIGTTNMEAQRSVIWNIGDIANSPDKAKALALFKKILLASASVPGLFEPVLIDVTAGGNKYEEIHVDGGVTSQVFLFPLKSSQMDKIAFEKAGIERNLFIIRNGKITPDYAAMKPTVLPMSQRSIETLIKYQGAGDLYRLYSGAARDGMNYRLTYIPSDFNEKSTEVFDPVYMSKLFNLGVQIGKDPAHWLKAPPGIEYEN
jgi:predicted acylesterase/phospholipase RssA